MDISQKDKKGNIVISLNAVATVTGNAVAECYGVLGLASKFPVRDGINELLGSEDYIKGITVLKNKKGIDVNVYIIVAYGVKITEVVSEVQKKIRYVLKKTLDLTTESINVYVKSTKVLS